jgi:hypothetical protein
VLNRIGTQLLSRLRHGSKLATGDLPGQGELPGRFHHQPLDVVTRPPHVAVNEVLIRPTEQER